jgi:hypothetical protein
MPTGSPCRLSRRHVTDSRNRNARSLGKSSARFSRSRNKSSSLEGRWRTNCASASGFLARIVEEGSIPAFDGVVRRSAVARKVRYYIGKLRC